MGKYFERFDRLVTKNKRALLADYEEHKRSFERRTTAKSWREQIAGRVSAHVFLLEALYVQEICKAEKNWAEVVAAVFFHNYGVWLTTDQVRNLCSPGKAAAHNEVYGETQALLDRSMRNDSNDERSHVSSHARPSSPVRGSSAPPMSQREVCVRSCAHNCFAPKFKLAQQTFRSHVGRLLQAAAKAYPDDENVKSAFEKYA